MARQPGTQTLAQVAYWYYLQELSQDEIATRVGVSRSQVSRLLRAARDQRVVRFQIDFPVSRDADLEARVRQRFADTPLRDVIVARTAHPGGTDRAQAGVMAAARAVVEWLPQHLKDGMVLGLSWGGTVQTFVDLAELPDPVDVRIVQLAGEIGQDPRHSGHDQVRELADKVGGRRHYFNTPAVVSTPELAAALAESPQVRDALSLGRASDIAVMGIGEFDHGMSRVFLDESGITDDERRDARAKGVIGQLCGRFFDRTGQQVDLDLHRRILSISLDELRQVPLKVVVAAAVHKRDPIIAATTGGLIDVLVVDDELASELAEGTP